MVLAAVKRSEEDILSNDGLSVVVNGKKIQFKERSIKRTKEWLRKVTEQDGSVLAEFLKAKKEGERLDICSSRGFDNLAALVSDYTDGAVTIEQIEEGTPRELEAAFNNLLEIAGFFALIWGKTNRLLKGSA